MATGWAQPRAPRSKINLPKREWSQLQPGTPPPDDDEYGQFGTVPPSGYDSADPYVAMTEAAELDSGFDTGFSDGVLMRALGLIALHPPAALLIADEMLPDSSDRTANLLREVVTLVRETPDMSTAALLAKVFRELVDQIHCTHHARINE